MHLHCSSQVLEEKNRMEVGVLKGCPGADVEGGFSLSLVGLFLTVPWLCRKREIKTWTDFLRLEVLLEACNALDACGCERREPKLG